MAVKRPGHFEIHVNDMERALKFYGDIFGWTFEDWSEYSGMPYFGAVTGPDDAMGINGALMQRRGDAPEPGSPVGGAVLTIITDDLDGDAEKILQYGGQVALPKQALPGMAWQAYYLDTEGNVFGLHMPDENAQ